MIGEDTHATGLGHRRAPVYELPERAVHALAHAARYAEWRRQPLGSRPDLPGVDADRTRSAVDHALAAGGGWQPYDRTAQILAGYGITFLPTVTATNGVEAVDAAEQLGYPVVLKSADPALVHKTDTGGVRLDLTGPDAVREAFDAVAAAGRPGAGALVRKQVTAPVELFAGVVDDPLFGSVVLLGLGGGAHRPARRPDPAHGPDDRPRRRPDVAQPASGVAAHRLPRRLTGRHHRAGGPAAAARRAGRDLWP